MLCLDGVSELVTCDTKDIQALRLETCLYVGG